MGIKVAKSVKKVAKKTAKKTSTKKMTKSLKTRMCNTVITRTIYIIKTINYVVSQKRKALAKIATSRRCRRAPGSGLPAAGAQGAECSPSGCYSPGECGRPRAACQRRSDAADQGGCPPCPGS